MLNADNMVIAGRVRRLKSNLDEIWPELRGWDNDFVVAMTIDIDILRAFQSRAKRWPDRDDLFKPMPSGFKVSSARKRLPP